MSDQCTIHYPLSVAFLLEVLLCLQKEHFSAPGQIMVESVTAWLKDVGAVYVHQVHALHPK